MGKAAIAPPALTKPQVVSPSDTAVIEADSPAAIRKLVFRLAWPSILENMLQSIYSIVLVMMVAQLGSASIAGVGASTSLIQVAMAGFFALSMGTTVLVAHATGAGNREAASRAAKQSLVLGLIIGVFVSALGLAFAPQAIRMLGAEPEVVAAGADYLRTFSLGGIFIVTTFVAGGVMRGSGDARTPMVVTLITLIVSLGVGYPLIFGKFGFPNSALSARVWRPPARAASAASSYSPSSSARGARSPCAAGPTGGRPSNRSSGSSTSASPRCSSRCSERAGC